MDMEISQDPAGNYQLFIPLEPHRGAMIGLPRKLTFLFAASPYLLEACKAALKPTFHWEDEDYGQQTLALLREAVARAEGREVTA